MLQIRLHGHTAAPKRNVGRTATTKQPNTSSQALLRRWAASLRRDDQGSSLIEISLAMPVLLALLTGISAFAVAFNNQLTLNNAVGTGAQYLQLIRTSSTDPCTDTVTAITNAAPNLNVSNITLTFNFNGTVTTAKKCPGSQSYLVQGQPVSVLATYPCTLAVFGNTFSACQLSAKVTEYEY